MLSANLTLDTIEQECFSKHLLSKVSFIFKFCVFWLHFTHYLFHISFQMSNEQVENVNKYLKDSIVDEDNPSFLINLNYDNLECFVQYLNQHYTETQQQPRFPICKGIGTMSHQDFTKMLVAQLAKYAGGLKEVPHSTFIFAPCSLQQFSALIGQMYRFVLDSCNQAALKKAEHIPHFNLGSVGFLLHNDINQATQLEIMAGKDCIIPFKQFDK